MYIINRIKAYIEKMICKILYLDVNKSKPFYNKFLDVYQLYKNEKSYEIGDITYIVSEYTKSGLIYHFSIDGEEDHEHSFNAVLDCILECDGKDFSIDDYEDEYSKQEIEMINNFIRKLRENIE